jgi:hypothetical protein
MAVAVFSLSASTPIHTQLFTGPRALYVAFVIWSQERLRDATMKVTGEI